MMATNVADQYDMTAAKFSSETKKLTAACIDTGMTIAMNTMAKMARGTRRNIGSRSWKFSEML